jgi:hypothetical protein
LVVEVAHTGVVKPLAGSAGGIEEIETPSTNEGAGFMRNNSFCLLGQEIDDS